MLRVSVEGALIVLDGLEQQLTVGLPVRLGGLSARLPHGPRAAILAFEEVIERLSRDLGPLGALLRLGRLSILALPLETVPQRS